MTVINGIPSAIRYWPIARHLGLLLFLFSSVALGDTLTHYYDVTVGSDKSRMFVVAQFGQMQMSVSARSRNAGRFLLDLDPCRSENIPTRRRNTLQSDQGMRCLHYTVDLEAVAKEYRESETLYPDSIVVPPSKWLWRPEVDKNSTIQITFNLPDDMRVSAPWQKLKDSDTAFVFGRSPASAEAPIVIGNFVYREIEVAGAVLRISLLEGNETMDHDKIITWLRATATNISLAYGRFPHPSPQIVVIPVGKRANKLSIVPFGMVSRDGGEAVTLFVDPAPTLQALMTDWTATHELSHLMLPNIERRHRWISEGFAQYYQNILLTRANAYDPLYAWKKLQAGFERGRNSRPGLSPNAATAVGGKEAIMKIYWSGAALALMADVKLRTQGDSLDTLLGRFQACCLPANRSWSGPEFFQKLDTFAKEPVFMPLYRRYADNDKFPETDELLRRLGVVITDSVVHFEAGAELELIRKAITRADIRDVVDEDS